MYQKTNRNQKKQGFTIIELMLAMGFVGSLLVIIALIIIQIMGIYNRGLTIKEVNQVSRTVVRDMQQSISGVDAFKVRVHLDADDSDSPLEVADTLDRASNQNADFYSNPAGGRLCTGSYSYIWNTSKALESYNQRLNGFTSGNEATEVGGYDIQMVGPTHNEKPVRFVKISDPSKTFCRNPDPSAGAGTPNKTSIGNNPDEFTNVLGAGNNELTVYKFEISTHADINIGEGSELTAASSFYYIQMILGTQAGDENTAGTDPTCNPPDDGSEYEYNEGEYCAINKIEFVARTGGISG